MRCSSCGFENPSGTRFCGSCGGGLAATAAPAKQRCSACGASVPATLRFCGLCGAPVGLVAAPAGPAAVGSPPPTAPPAPAASTATPSSGSVRSFVQGTLLPFLRSAQEEPTGLQASGVVLITCALFSFLSWDILGLVTQIVGALIPRGNCASLQPATPIMYACSAGVGLLAMAGPLVTMGVIYVFRRQLTEGAKRLAPRLPLETRFLIAPTIATAIFVISWAGMHYATAGETGLLPQRFFPGAIGLFTYVVTRFGSSLQARLGPFFDFRDRYPSKARFAAAILLPLVISLVITAEARVSQTAMKEQLVVVISLATGYLAVAPRSGDLLSGVRRAVPLDRLKV